MTFKELDRRANGIAHAVTSLVAPGERACILTESKLGAAAGVLGLCKTGLICVRLKPDQPAAYLRSILMDADARLILTTREHLGLAQSLCTQGMHIIDVDDDCHDCDNPPEWKPHPDDRIAIAYTSGSTGRPKGVVQTHRSTSSFVTSYLSRTNLNRHDCVAMLHDSRGMDMFGALATGATSCLFPLERQGMWGLAEWLIHHRITVLPTVPSVLRHMVKAISGRRDELKIRLLRLSGEILTPDDVRRAAAVFPASCRVLNWFGSTEVAVASCSFSFDERDQTSITAGRVFDGLEVGIVDEDGTPVETNHAGEIVVSSRSLFGGYWKREDLDAAKISSDPHRPGFRRFHTGDTGYLDSHGRLVVLGRMDAQFKVNGYRVEPCEVEEAIRSVPGIEDALVRLVNGGGGSESALAAYVVVDTVAPPSVASIRRQLAHKVPRHMIPAYFVRTDAMPRLWTGKPDRAALPDLVPASRRDYNSVTEGPE